VEIMGVNPPFTINVPLLKFPEPLFITDIPKGKRRMARKHIEDVERTENVPFPFRVVRRALRVGDRIYNRGSIIDDATLAGCANAATWISGGYIARVPAAPPRANPPRPEIAPVEIKPTDHVAIARAALAQVAKARGISKWDAIDLIPSDILNAARGVYGRAPKLTKSGAWGGGGTLIPNGAGIGQRRCVEGFEAFLCGDRTLDDLRHELEQFLGQPVRAA
jgi:hypothetical protein